MQFKLNDRVEWVSQAQGVRKQKNGIVVAVIPAGSLPREIIGKCKVDAGTCMPRKYESYVVQVGSKQYWPHVDNLRIDGERKLQMAAPDADRIIRTIALFIKAGIPIDPKNHMPEDGYDGAPPEQTLADAIRAYLEKVDGGTK